MAALTTPREGGFSPLEPSYPQRAAAKAPAKDETKMSPALLDEATETTIARLLDSIEPYICDPATAHVELNERRREILVRDGSVEASYRFVSRTGTPTSWGWRSLTRDLVTGEEASFLCKTHEPYAVLRDYGPEYEAYVMRLMRPVVRELGRGPAEHRARARHLLSELRMACDLTRVGVAQFHEPIREAMLEGNTLSALCWRGGFVNGAKELRPDGGWFVRRIGLRPGKERKTGKVFVARTVTYEAAVKYCRALDLAPVEMGL
jgi:hypothetical protein